MKKLLRRFVAPLAVLAVAALAFAPAAFASVTYGPSDFHGLDITAQVTGSGTSTQLMGFRLKDVTTSCMSPTIEIQGPPGKVGTMMDEVVRLCPGGSSTPTLYGPYTPAGPYLFAVYLPGWGWWEHSITVS